MLELAPGALINFCESRVGREGGGLYVVEGERLSRFSNFSLNMTLPLFQVNTTNKSLRFSTEHFFRIRMKTSA